MPGSPRLLSSLSLLACLACNGAPAIEAEATASEDQPAVVSGPGAASAPSDVLRSRGAVAFALADVPSDIPIPGGIAGGESVILLGSPLDGRVVALSRSTGAPIGELPPPSAGFVLPFILHTIGPGRVAVLDAGGFPSPKPLVLANPIIYEYAYSDSGGAFRATLERTISFTGATIGFAEDMTRLPDGGYLVSDAVLGSIWRVDREGNVHPGIVPKTFDPADAIPELAFCPTMPEVTVGNLPFLFTESSIPGVASFAVRDGVVYFNSSCAGGVFRFPFASLFDHREPWQRADGIHSVSLKPAGVQVEELLDMTFDPFDAEDDGIYAADALQLRVIRIDPHSGRRTVVAADPRLLDFPSSLAFVPPTSPHGRAPLLVLSNQQERTPLLNDAITSDVTVLPYLVTEVLATTPR
jgi:hypothetical protein